MHCVKSVQIRSYFSGPYFPVFSPNTGKYGPEITPYLVIFHAVIVIDNLKADNCFRLTQVDEAK